MSEKSDKSQDSHPQGMGLNWAQKEALKCWQHWHNADDREIEESRCLKIFLVGLVGHVTQEVLAPSKGSRDTTQAETVNTVRRT